MALAKLCAVACGGAVIGGGAVHVAEGARTGYVKATKVKAKKRYVRRVVKRPVKKITRVVKTTTTRSTDCYAPGGYSNGPGASYGYRQTAEAVECGRVTVTAAVPLPPMNQFPVSGGSVAPAVVGGGFGGSGGFFSGGFFGGGASGGGGSVVAIEIENSNNQSQNQQQQQDQKQNQEQKNENHNSNKNENNNWNKNENNWSSTGGWSSSGCKGCNPHTPPGPPSPVPAPPMVLLFGAAAAALMVRKRFAKKPAAFAAA